MRLVSVLVLFCQFVLAQDLPDKHRKIEKVECLGNIQLNCKFISRLVLLEAGDDIDPDNIEKYKFRLSALPYFKSVQIFIEEGSSPNFGIIKIQVVESSQVTKEILANAHLPQQVLMTVGLVRLGHHNLFGNGHAFELSVRGGKNGDKLSRAFVGFQARYVNPQLFDSQRFFLIANAMTFAASYNYEKGEYYKSISDKVDLGFGYRFGYFSYIGMGYEHFLGSKVTERFLRSDGSPSLSLFTRENSFKHGTIFFYGWNSEDDQYFPTQGSRLVWNSYWYFSDLYSKSYFSTFGMRKTWSQSERSFWTLRLGDSPGTETRNPDDFPLQLSISFASKLDRGRWYLEPGFAEATNLALRFGVRTLWESLGLVDLSVVVSKQ